MNCGCDTVYMEIKKEDAEGKKNQDIWAKLRFFLTQRDPMEINKSTEQASIESPPKNMDEFSLLRFKHAQDSVYKDVLRELQNGKKESHWVWYIFPQIVGMGRSDTARYFSIKSIKEAQAYLKHPLLGERLFECTKLLLDIQNKSGTEVLGAIDFLKVKSSMTLFHKASPKNPMFKEVLDKYYKSELDEITMAILKKIEKKDRESKKLETPES